jgi:hypothetical protein
MLDIYLVLLASIIITIFMESGPIIKHILERSLIINNIVIGILYSLATLALGVLILLMAIGLPIGWHFIIG